MRFTLRHRVLIILAGFVLITFLLGLILVWYTFRMGAAHVLHHGEAPFCLSKKPRRSKSPL